ncbi:MAG: DUF2341 domain-containing protein [Patescibacteria group bacterium]|nr:DUF2341 domain-containing protein [Patescibacteria group bacterium]
MVSQTVETISYIDSFAADFSAVSHRNPGRVLGVTTGIQWYVSPNGSASGNGSINNPWDLRTALSGANGAVKPGDTIWLRGGTYSGKYESRLNGIEGSPIVVRQYPGERATIDANSIYLTPATLEAYGSYTWFWGFEIKNSNPIRYSPNSGSNPDDGRASGVSVFGTNLKFINLVVHDTGTGLGYSDNYSTSGNMEFYGNIVYNNGWVAPDRGHGHGTYMAERYVSTRVADNIIFNGADHGSQFYGSGDGAWINNFTIEGNSYFNNGALAGGDVRNILVGGGITNQNNIIRNNYSYFTPLSTGQSLNIGYNAGGTTNPVVTDNYISGITLFSATRNLTLTGNTFNGSVDFQYTNTPYNYLSGYAGNTHVQYGTRPTGTKVFVRPNEYEQGRANITIFNWDRLNSVNVDLSNVLSVGAQYEIRDVQNYYGAPIASGTYSGGSVAIPTTNTQITQPICSGTCTTLSHTDKEFNVFVVVPTGMVSNPSVDTTPPQVVITSPTPNQVVGSSVQVTAEASDNNGILGVQLKLDGQNLRAEYNRPPYSTTLDTAPLSPGIHIVTAVARDAAGNTTTAAPVAFNVTDLVPPAISGGLPSGSLPAGTTSANVTFSTNEPATCRYSTYSTGFSSMTGQAANTSGNNFSFAVSGLQDGSSYAYYIRCQDNSAQHNANGDDYVIAFSIVPGGSTSGNQWYVSPSGLSANNGSINSPWDLRSVLANNANGRIQPGDTVWMRGGIYNGLYTSNLTGSASKPVILRQYPGEHAAIDGGCDGSDDAFRVNGAHAWYWGFEIMSSCTNTRLGGAANRAKAVETYGPDIKMINLVIHDLTGYSAWIAIGNTDTEIYGNLIYNDGYEGGLGDRGHGHGIYTQNAYGTKHYTDNIIFDNFGHGIQAYGTNPDARADNMTFEGNTSFDSGMVANLSAQPAANLILGTLESSMQNLVVKNNYTYYPVGNPENRGISVKYNGALNPVVQDNYVASDQAVAFELDYQGSATVTGNTFYGSVSGVNSSTHPNNIYYTSRPTGVKVFVRPNKYDTGRANITIYNWNQNVSVPVDVSNIGLQPGDTYEIRNAQNYWNEKITGVYNGSPISIPMNGWTVVKPMGWDYAPPTTFPTFGAFIIQKAAAGSNSGDTVQPTVSITSPANGQTVSGIIPLKASAADNSGMVSVMFEVDGSAASPELAVAPFNTSLNTFGLESGKSHIIKAIARDAAGNKAESSITITVNNPQLTCNQPVNGAFVGCYYNGTNFDSLKLMRMDPAVDFSWSYGSPDSSMPTDGFSVRWVGNFDFDGSLYTFSATPDDGIRVYVDNQMVIDKWYPQTGVTYTADKAMTAGVHEIKVEYFEQSGGATARVNWVKKTTTPPSSNQKPIGSLDGVKNDGTVYGWAKDPDNESQAISVHLYFDGQPGSNVSPIGVTAGDNRSDIGNHAFNFSIPDSYKDGKAHKVYAYGIDLNDATGASNVLLPGSPKTFTLSPVPQSVSDPVISPNGGSFTSSQTVTISSATSGAIIYYSTDGSNPSLVYSSPVTLTQSATVKAKAVKNGMTDSNVVSAGFTKSISSETVPPTVDLTAPAAGVTVVGMVNLAANASDNVGVAGVQFKVDGVNIGSEDTAVPYAVSWDSTSVANGSHTISVVVRDTSGNIATDSAAVTVINPIPDTYRVNVGGSAYTDPAGVVWSADKNYSGGNNYGVSSAIANTNASALYQTSRYGGFAYNFNVPNGAYQVKLKFAETYWAGAGNRLFNVSLNNSQILTSFDIFAQAGGINKALDKTFTVNVIDGKISLQFTTMSDNAMVNAIEITPAGSAPSQVSDPAISPNGGTFTSAQTVTLSSATSGATIYYSTDGSNPSLVYSSPITLTQSATVKAKAVKSGMTDSNIVSAAFTKQAASDTTPPAVSIASPANNSTVSNSITLSASTSDNVGVAGVQFKVDGVSQGSEDTAAPYELVLDTKTLSNASHTISATARDAAGNAATASVTVTVNNPVVPSSCPSPATNAFTGCYYTDQNLTNFGSSRTDNSINFNWSTGKPDSTIPADHFSVRWQGNFTFENANYDFVVTADDGVRVYVDGIPVVDQWKDQAPTTYKVTKALTAGGHLVKVEYYDNTDLAIAQVLWTKQAGGSNPSDTTLPTVSITSPANNSTVSNSITLSASATDNVGVAGVQFKVDGTNQGTEDTAAPYELALDTKTLSNASHTISAVARDAAGNAATASVTVTVNNSETLADWYNASWNYRQKLTVNHGQVAGNLSNFPVLVSLSSNDLKSTVNGGKVGKTDGTDIVFVSQDNKTKLFHELDSYNSSTGQLTAWVKLPSLSSSNDTAFYVYYGNGYASDQQDKAGVWDGDFRAVYHGNNLSDSKNSRSMSGSNGLASGKIGQALTFDGSSQKVSSTAFAGDRDTSFTYELWFKPASTWQTGSAAVKRLIESVNYNDSAGPSLYYSSATGKLSISNFLPSYGRVSTDYATTLDANQWYHIAGTYNSAGYPNQNLYVNGKAVNYSSYFSYQPVRYDELLTLGGSRLYSASLADGSMDEVRVSKTARSESWIATEYNNQNNPSGFVAVGSVESQNGLVLGEMVDLSNVYYPYLGQYSQGNVVLEEMAGVNNSYYPYLGQYQTNPFFLVMP